MSKYCILPFINVRIEPDNQQWTTETVSNGFRPCCDYRYDSPVRFDSLESYLESSELRTLQNHLLTQDELPNGCNQCSVTERNNEMSVRKWRNNYFNNERLDKTDIRIMDIFLSNTCNLTCIMCKPYYSSAVSAENKRLNEETMIFTFDRTDQTIAALQQLKGLQEVNIAGGEFFYHKRHEEVLDVIHNLGINKVKFITNGTVCSDKLIKKLSRIPELALRISVDGTDEHYNAIRYPAVWEDTKANVINFKNSLPLAHMEMILTLQPLNIFNLLTWAEFGNKHNIETHLQVVRGPSGWQILTPEEKQQATEWVLSNYKNYNISGRPLVHILNLVKNTIPQMPYDPIARTQFVDRVCKLMKLRNQKFETMGNLLGVWDSLREEMQQKFDLT